MFMTAVRRDSTSGLQRRHDAMGWPVAVIGATLAVAVTVIHILDQGGVGAMKDPAYLGYGYWALELAGLVSAGLLFSRYRRLGWLLAAAVATGPLVGITISRSVGLPNATEDIGNWGEPIGVMAMVVEAALLLLAALMLRRSSPDQSEY